MRKGPRGRKRPGDVQESTVDPQGRITIPKAIRDHLGLKPGDQIEYAVAPDGRVKLVPAPLPAAHLTRRQQTPSSLV
jgi:AbrB family looped-hinge helix DNA binding protein